MTDDQWAALKPYVLADIAAQDEYDELSSQYETDSLELTRAQIEAEFASLDLERMKNTVLWDGTPPVV